MAWQDYYTRDMLVERIRRHAGRGLSVRDTAWCLGFDITPGVVAGLARRAEPPVQFGKIAPPKPKFIVVADGDSDSVHQDALVPRDQHCRYPLWTASRPKRHELRYCGRQTVAGTSWCEECSHKVFKNG
jgi:hypothetical protein